MRRPEEVLVFVRRGDEFLVLHRSEEHDAYWHSVSGALEEGETSMQAAARELLEETGLDATPWDLGRPYSYNPEPWESHFQAGGPPISVECFVVDAPVGWEPQLDWEHDGYRWCRRDEAVALFHWPDVRDAFAAIGERTLAE